MNGFCKAPSGDARRQEIGRLALVKDGGTDGAGVFHDDTQAARQFPNSRPGWGGCPARPANQPKFLSWGYSEFIQTHSWRGLQGILVNYTTVSFG